LQSESSALGLDALNVTAKCCGFRQANETQDDPERLRRSSAVARGEDASSISIPGSLCRYVRKKLVFVSDVPRSRIAGYVHPWGHLPQREAGVPDLGEEMDRRFQQRKRDAGMSSLLAEALRQ